MRTIGLDFVICFHHMLYCHEQDVLIERFLSRHKDCKWGFEGNNSGVCYFARIDRLSLTKAYSDLEALASVGDESCS